MHKNILDMFIFHFDEIEILIFSDSPKRVLVLKTCHFSSDFGTFSGRVRVFPNLEICVELSQDEASWVS